MLYAFDASPAAREQMKDLPEQIAQQILIDLRSRAELATELAPWGLPHGPTRVLRFYVEDHEVAYTVLPCERVIRLVAITRLDPHADVAWPTASQRSESDFLLRVPLPPRTHEARRFGSACIPSDACPRADCHDERDGRPGIIQKG